MTPPVHLAKVPYDLWLVTWCGQEQKRPRRNVAAPTLVVTRIDGGPIRSIGSFTCHACRRAVEAQSRALLDILELLAPTERQDTRALGCGDNSCHLRRPGGMATNGGCRCELRQLRLGASVWRAYALALEARR